MSTKTLVFSHFALLAFLTSTLWLIVKVLLKKNTKSKWILLAGVISTPILYQLIVWAFLFWFVPSTPTRDFDEVTWRNEVEKRAEMIDDLIESETLLNQSATEVLQILGEPDYGDTANYLIYHVGEQYIGGYLNYASLDIKIERDSEELVVKSASRAF